HGAELAGPDHADGHRTALRLTRKQHGVEIHGRPRAHGGTAHGGTWTHAFAWSCPRCLTGSRRRPLLASCLQHVGLGRAGALGRALARQPDPARAFVDGIDLEALAGAVALGATERMGRLDAIRCTIRRHHTAHTTLSYL